MKMGYAAVTDVPYLAGLGSKLMHLPSELLESTIYSILLLAFFKQYI